MTDKTTAQDINFMRLALEEARRGRGLTGPNPMVGAVIAHGERVLGRGFHRGPGNPHAEVEALREARDAARGATLYVTLEPCCTQGRTGPCTNEIISAGISNVVIGTLDPNPNVDGRGQEILRKAGIQVSTGTMEKEVRELNEAYNKFITRNQPFVTLKVALSLDGKIAAAEGRRTSLSSEEAKNYVKRLRAEHDAVLIGSRTALIDDPLLAVGPEDKAMQPVRVVADSFAALPLESRLVKTAGRIPTYVAVAPDAPPDKCDKLASARLSLIRCAKSDGGIDLQDLLDWLAKLEFSSILVEAGSRLATSFIEKMLVDKYVFILAPLLLGGSGPSVISTKEPLWSRLRIAEHTLLGDDLVVTAYPA